MPHTPVHIWAPLIPIWNIGAYATSLFDWKAIAALGTFWAVVVALGRDGRATRQEAAGQQALLSALSIQAGALADMLYDCQALCPTAASSIQAPAPAQKIAEANSLAASDAVGLTRQMFNAIKVTDLRDHSSILEFVTAQAAVHQIAVKIPLIINGGADLLDDEAGALRDAEKAWLAQADLAFSKAYPLRALFKKVVPAAHTP